MPFLNTVVPLALRRRRVRNAGSSALAAAAASTPPSAATPSTPSAVASSSSSSSGFAFVDNSRGSSAAIAELSRSLDVAIDQLDAGQHDLSDQLELHLRRLQGAARKYANCEAPEPGEGEEEEGKGEGGGKRMRMRRCSQSQAQLTAASFECAAAAYGNGYEPRVDGGLIFVEEMLDPSLMGTSKAVGFYLVENDPSASRAWLLPRLLVIAVRGSASRVDNMVNLNSEPKDAKGLFSPQDIYPESASPWKEIATPNQILAHGGFLHNAHALMPTVTKTMVSLTRRHSIQQVVFAGHSAGGAVAALLFTAFLSRAPTHYPTMKFSLEAFGPPPCIRADDISIAIGHNPKLSSNLGSMVTWVNEHDLIPRVDASYVRALVDLYRSIYHLPPIQDKDSIPQASKPLQPQLLPKFAFEAASSSSNAPSSKKYFALPEPEYGHVGPIALMKVKVASRGTDFVANTSSHVAKESGDYDARGEDVGAEGDDDEDELELTIFDVEPDEFAEFLFCSAVAHRRTSYQERMKMLLNGEFNGRGYWPLALDDESALSVNP